VSSLTPISSSPSKRRTDSDKLDSYSLKLVSSLQGCTDYQEARAQARAVLKDFQKELEDTASIGVQKAEKCLNANKVLSRAVNIMKEKVAETQSQSRLEIEYLQRKLVEMEERAKTAEHTAGLLRWHLEQDGSRGSNGFNRPPDIF